LETVTGKFVDVAEPNKDDICIDDIAWGLSRTSRFCGMTITEIPYNVAQHSVFVAQEVKSIFEQPEKYSDLKDIQDEIKKMVLVPTEPNRTILLALLHDSAEIFTGDIPSPMKQVPELRPIVKKIEAKLMAAIYEKFHLSEPSQLQATIIKHADKIAQRVEAHAFMQSRGNHWLNMPKVSLEKLQQFPAPMKALDSYHLFMDFFDEYFNAYTSDCWSIQSRIVSESENKIAA
jgi:5'-deoxynucleotidase YfbR-like HD superfamily hydrolase